MLFYTDNKLVIENKWNPIRDLDSLALSWENKNTNTLLIYDVDAPYPNNSVTSPFIQYLVTNVVGDDVSNGDVTELFG